MNTHDLLSRRSAAVALAIFLLPRGTFAQGAPAPSSSTSQGPMIVERVKSGFLVEPQIKVTSFDHQTSELVGADAGWLADQMFFIGGGGYWMVNQNHDRELAYGGLVLGFTTPADRPFSFGTKTLFGGGHASVPGLVAVYPTPSPYPDGVPGPGGRPSVVLPTPTVTTVGIGEGFFVLEPQANVGFQMSKRVRLTASGGYRFMGWGGYWHDPYGYGYHDLGGWTGSFGVQIVPGS
jgi:hypothetical protein